MHGIFKCQILPRLGDRIATELKKSDVQQALNDIAADPASQSRSIVEKCLTHVRAVFDFAIEDELLERNPTLKVELPLTRRPSERFLTLEECQRLLDVANRRDRLIIRLFVVCGFRPAEFFALRVNDVRDGRLRIDETAVPGEAVKQEAKTEGSRADVPLPPMLAAELLAYIKAEGLTDDQFLFPSATGTAMSHDNYLDRVLKKLGLLAGIDVVRNASGEPISSKLNHQTLRRTTGTHFQKHAELKSTQDLLRHANPTTTLKHYQKTLSEDLIAGVESWDAELRAGNAQKLPPRRAGRRNQQLRRVK
jgi:integrase